MPLMQQVAKDDPLMVAWEAYKATEEYANTKRWATTPEHTEGSLWAAFEAGFNTPKPARVEITEEMVDDAVEAWHKTKGLLDDVMRAVLTAALTPSPSNAGEA